MQTRRQQWRLDSHIMNARPFLGELKRRHVYRVAVGYGIAGWALAQGIAQVFPVFDISNWAIRLTVVLIALGFPVALVLAWLFDLTPEGIKRTNSVETAAVRGSPVGKLEFAAITIAVLLLAIGVVSYEYFLQPKRASSIESAHPLKSLAVLPFDNLSSDKENAFFADGVHDQILSDLAKIADLKVISRTSVMQYKTGIARNLRRIGDELGVAHVVEGSVQRAGNKVRVNVQLIDAHNDAHLWGQTYDRDLANVFAIQSEIAKAIADQLQAKLSPAEKSAIERPPTFDLIAFDQYTRAKTLILTTSMDVSADKALVQATDLLNSAVARDPSFYVAFCQLVGAHDRLYSVVGDHTPERLRAAEAALQRATDLRPDAPETHLARGAHLYYAFRDYKGALAELKLASIGLPNDPRVFAMTGFIHRRQGNYEEGLRALEQAVTLDPRNTFTLSQLSITYQLLRRYADRKAKLQRVLEITPDDVGEASEGAFVDFLWRADPAPFHQFIERLRAERPAALGEAADNWLDCALAQRDWVTAEKALTALGGNFWWVDNAVSFSRHFGEGLLARAMNDEARARKAFGAARAEQEQVVQKQKDYGPALCVLGVIDAGLGNKQAAIEEGRRAMELLPVEKDSVNGQAMRVYFALIAAWVGEKDLALQHLAVAAPTPGASLIASYGILKLSPFWDPLRGDPRFEKIVASLAPK